MRWGCRRWVRGTGGVGITPRMSFQVSQPPPGRQLAVPRLSTGHNSVPLTPKTTHRSRVSAVLRNPKDCPKVNVGVPMSRESQMALRLPSGQTEVGPERCTCLVEACLFPWPLRSLSRRVRIPHFSLFQSPSSSLQHFPAAAPLAWAPSAALFPRNPRPQTTPSPTPPPCRPPPGRGSLSLAPSYTACALRFAEPVSF